MSDLETPKKKLPTWVRLTALVLLLASLYGVGVLTGLDQYLSADQLRETIGSWGAWGVLFFLVAFAVGNLIQLPGMAFVAVSVLVYGRFSGSALALVGALLAVSVSFWVARGVGGKPLAEIKKPWLRKVLSQLDERPVRTVILLRALTWMSPPVNMALALSKVRYRDYAMGSAIGLLVPVLGAAFLFDILLT